MAPGGLPGVAEATSTAEGATRARDLLEELLSQVKGADEVEACLINGESALTRFANSTIHQNVVERETNVRLRVVVGNRVGVVAGSGLEPAALRTLAEDAVTVARQQSPNSEWTGLPKAGPVPEPLARGWSEATAACSPEHRAEAVARVCARALAAGSEAFGAFKTGAQQLAVLNSHGRFAYDRATVARFVTVTMGPGSGTGYAERSAVDVHEVDTDAAAAEAVDKAVRTDGARDVEPGAYEVVLEHYCTAELLLMMSLVGLGALSVQEKRSFMRLGEQITGSRVTVEDDGRAPWTLPSSVDYEGVAKQPLVLIDEGVARAVVHDSFTAGREGVSSTGHALAAPNPYGPIATNLRLRGDANGASDVRELARGIKRGLWVTRFHYVNVVEPMSLTLTGMTRDGTFLIENGEVGPPVKNLRFTQGALEAMRDVRGLGSQEHLLVEDSFGLLLSYRVPAMHLGSFNFTSGTSF